MHREPMTRMRADLGSRDKPANDGGRRCRVVNMVGCARLRCKTSCTVGRPALPGHRHDSKWAGKLVPHRPEMVGSRPTMTYFSSSGPAGRSMPSPPAPRRGSGRQAILPRTMLHARRKTPCAVSRPGHSGNRPDPKWRSGASFLGRRGSSAVAEDGTKRAAAPKDPVHRETPGSYFISGRPLRLAVRRETVMGFCRMIRHFETMVRLGAHRAGTRRVSSWREDLIHRERNAPSIVLHPVRPGKSRFGRRDGSGRSFAPRAAKRPVPWACGYLMHREPVLEFRRVTRQLAAMVRPGAHLAGARPVRFSAKTSYAVRGHALVDRGYVPILVRGRHPRLPR